MNEYSDQLQNPFRPLIQERIQAMMNQSKQVQQTDSTNPKDAFGRQKPGVSDIPAVAIIHESLAMRSGREKYGPANWRDKTVSLKVYVDAMYRHILSYFDGEDFDPESGVHHLGHVRANAGIILDAMEQGTLIDDRPTNGKAGRVLERLTRRTGMPNAEHRYTIGADVSDGHDSEGCVTAISPELLGQIGGGPDRETMYVFCDLQGLLESMSGIPEAMLKAGDGDVVSMTATEMQALQRNQRSSAIIRKKRCYIAGPMRGIEKFNFPAFDRARDLAIKEGWNPTSPADLDRENNIKEDTAPQFQPHQVRAFAERDTRALLDMKAEYGDAIALLPGWEKSTGALSEFFLARWLGLAILDAETMLPFSGLYAESMGLVPVTRAIRNTLKGE